MKKYVMAVLLDDGVKNRMAAVQRLIQEAPGNKGGAKMIISYYEKWKTNQKR